MSTAELITLIMAAMAKAPEVWGIIEQARHGALTPDEALAKIAACESQSTAVDTAADAAAQAAIDLKFDAGKS